MNEGLLHMALNMFSQYLEWIMLIKDDGHDEVVYC